MGLKAFTNKTAIVTGAASGIGREMARQLAQHGSSVLVTDITQAGVDAVTDEIVAAGGSAKALVVDVSKREDVQAAVDQVVAEHGRLDYIFNNAGVAIFGPFDEVSLDDWDKIIDVNLRGVAYGSTIAYKQMVKQGSGHIVNTASMAGIVPVPLQAHYVATKHAVVGMSKTLAVESKNHGISVTAFCPAFVESGMFDNNTLRGELEGIDTRKMMPIKPLPTSEAVSRLLDRVEQKSLIVIVPFYGKIGYWMERLSPSLAMVFHRFALKETRKRAAKNRR